MIILYSDRLSKITVEMFRKRNWRKCFVCTAHHAILELSVNSQDRPFGDYSLGSIETAKIGFRNRYVTLVAKTVLFYSLWSTFSSQPPNG